MFVSALYIEELPEGKKRLTLPLIYVDVDNKATIVPLGFITDYASVPKTPLLYLLFSGVADRSSTLHDFLYSSKATARADADSLFLAAMLEEKTPRWKAHAMYYAVRLFGKAVRAKAYGINHE